ncbi:MAG: trehalose-6-phosphate synthase, partial [Methylocella sp.]
QAPDNPGVLVLSQFAGAAHELKSALIVNPYDIEATASAIARALAMPLEERKDRWSAMMTVLRANSIHDWTAHFLQALGNQPEGKEIDSPLTGGARPPAAAGQIRTSPDRARLDGLAELCDLAGVAVPGAYFLTKS